MIKLVSTNNNQIYTYIHTYIYIYIYNNGKLKVKIWGYLEIISGVLCSSLPRGRLNMV